MCDLLPVLSMKVNVLMFNTRLLVNQPLSPHKQDLHY